MVLALVGCGGDDETTSTVASPGVSETEASEQSTAAQASLGMGTTLKVADSDYGRIVFDGDSQAIYLFDKEDGATSECYGECAAAWPPVLTKGEPLAGPGIKKGLLGTTKRKDGTTQVTYNGHPLYYYVNDPKGEAYCHDVLEFGGTWLVLDAAGNAV